MSQVELIETEDTSWSNRLAQEKRAEYFQEVMAFVESEREAGKVIFPPADKVFNAFALTELSKLKVVILGQDPYHGPGQANGLAFSVNRGVRIPPSLHNIYREMRNDLGIELPSHGDLSHWAKQGVLLLNTVLTVEQSKAHSHQNRGWETFTDQVIKFISDMDQFVVFLLWGAPARRKKQLIDPEKNAVLEAPHPSPLSAHRGFLGCRHFSQANELLVRHDREPIDWHIKE